MPTTRGSRDLARDRADGARHDDGLARTGRRRSRKPRFSAGSGVLEPGGDRGEVELVLEKSQLTDDEARRIAKLVTDTMTP
jgi:hypothetical protein